MILLVTIADLWCYFDLTMDNGFSLKDPWVSQFTTVLSSAACIDTRMEKALDGELNFLNEAGHTSLVESRVLLWLFDWIPAKAQQWGWCVLLLWPRKKKNPYLTQLCTRVFLWRLGFQELEEFL